MTPEEAEDRDWGRPFVGERVNERKLTDAELGLPAEEISAQPVKPPRLAPREEKKRKTYKKRDRRPVVKHQTLTQFEHEFKNLEWREVTVGNTTVSVPCSPKKEESAEQRKAREQRQERTRHLDTVLTNMRTAWLEKQKTLPKTNRRR